MVKVFWGREEDESCLRENKVSSAQWGKDGTKVLFCQSTPTVSLIFGTP